MKGLMVKDLRLLANQKQFFLIVVFMSVMLIISGQNMFFIVSYGTMICSFFTISTINYDEFNNGYEFLFTMPISRWGYVFETILKTHLLPQYFHSEKQECVCR